VLILRRTLAERQLIGGGGQKPPKKGDFHDQMTVKMRHIRFPQLAWAEPEKAPLTVGKPNDSGSLKYLKQVELTIGFDSVWGAARQFAARQMIPLYCVEVVIWYLDVIFRRR
jgi:hypothetical protein